ncbi:VRR-NUC domain-containing protein [Arcanobacterium canis]
MLEKHLEQQLKKAVEDAGGWCIKLVSPGNAGMPDRLCLKAGRAVFVEVKQPGKQPRRLQLHRMKQLRAHGFTTLVVDEPVRIKEVLDALLAA